MAKNQDSEGNFTKLAESVSDRMERNSSVDSMEEYANRVAELSPVSPPMGTTNGSINSNSTRQIRMVPLSSELQVGERKAPGGNGVKEWATRYFEKKRVSCSQYTFIDWLNTLIPCSRWLATYQWRSFIIADIIAGLTVGIMVIPQSMSYAGIAGLPPNFGLYGAFYPVLAYAVFGSSRQLAVGPVAITSLLLEEGLTPLVPGKENIHDASHMTAQDETIMQDYVHKSIQISLLVAILYMVVGIFRLGFLSNFLSHSVISGFTTGAALIIGLSQLKYILGYNIDRSSQVHVVLESLFENISQFQWKEFLMGIFWIFLLLLFKELGKRNKKLKFLRPVGPLTVSVISIVLVLAFKLDEKGIAVVGDIPKGLPPISIDLWFPIKEFDGLIKIAVLIMIVGLMESISIAKALALKNKYELDSNQELVGLGIANVAGAAFSAYPTTGSFSRSAVANDTGAKSGIAGLITAILVGFILLFLTPVFENMPLNALAAIVISGVVGLFEVGTMISLFKLDKLDWLVWITSFLGTIFLGVEVGLGIAIGLALLIVIYQSAFPHTAILGRLPGTTVYRNIKQYPEARAIEGILLVRVDSPIYFANVQWVKDRLKKYEDKAEAIVEQQGKKIRYVILDMSPVSNIDATGVHVLEEIVHEYKEREVQLVLCNPSRKVMTTMENAGLTHLIGRDYIFVRMHDAVMHCQMEDQEQKYDNAENANTTN
eukprot:TRINITY_DN19038_c0_g1_i2.p1 TRINITY_DN19038_c0_g1~~TRINITY_DN19038_c0_g1_i2.p1  ORF type:complete len:768 (-),score=144.29 TRINITY_DN19038_c0_g1_i2:2692-4830(-)